MPYKRKWDDSCPHVYDQWESDGISWVIQDLPPEDDEEAVDLLLTNLAPDEPLCCATGITKDEYSMHHMGEYWRRAVALRTSLACYAMENGKRTLAAMNCCLIISADDKEVVYEIKGEGWLNVYNAMGCAESRVNVYEMLGLDRVLYGMGLVVRREYRGAKLGAKLLAARKPFSLSQGVFGTSTVFSGPASQRSAEIAGFKTAVEVTFTQLAQAGLKYPHEDKSIKLMVQKYV